MTIEVIARGGAAVVAALAVLMAAGADTVGQETKAAKPNARREVSQYGVTWTFSEPRRVGRFVNGDWWVVGPAAVVRVTPTPGPAPEGEVTEIKKNQFGDAAHQNDRRMRNGSMIVINGSTRQGYDSRVKNYDPGLSVQFPRLLKPGESLISSISHTSLPNNNFAHKIMWSSEKKVGSVLRTAAVLTCLAEAPPEDAFRPSYAGTRKTIHRLGDVKWNRLPRLEAVGAVPNWKDFERYFQRPWIDHMSTWMIEATAPTENNPHYGREVARLVSMAGLMLQLDVPRAKKEKLLVGFVQLGIDLSGLCQAGMKWNLGGGHTSGRKWPIVFAGIVLGDREMLDFPATAVFHEDAQTYYGKGWFGQTALWQMVIHHGKAPTYEERPPEEWSGMDKRSESYRLCCNGTAWIGSALAARHMNAMKAWNHDAYFDYCDRWMRQDDPFAARRGKYKRPSHEGRTLDPWVTAMWRKHRPTAPKQPGATRNMKWVTGDGGKWIPNPKPKGAGSGTK